MNNCVINVDNVSMRFNLSVEKVDSIKEYIIKLLQGKLMYEEFWALNNINFQINKGERVGIVGLNGSGKSTLLKIISGVMKPTKGKITITGTIAPLIELGAGFDADLSARENIYLNGAILGFSDKEIDIKYDSIIEFAELQSFENVAIKNFSSGMIARLGFAIATCKTPDILIVDEILSVGDYEFQQKCRNRMKEMTDYGTTILFVSHSAEQVIDICDKAIWLKKGKIIEIGNASDVMNHYLNNDEKIEDKKEIEEVIDKNDRKDTNEAVYNKEYKNINFISLLRVFSICLVMWSNMVTLILDGLNYNWYPLQFIRNYFSKPLVLFQDFGSLGVMLFFLCSGFIITYVAQSETLREFILKRIMRIYPGLIFSVTIFWIIQKIFTTLTSNITYWGEFGIKEWIYGATLINYFRGLPNVINGVTWILIIEVIFYIICIFTYYFLKKKPILEILIMMAISILSIITATNFGEAWYGIASSISYLVIIIFGQILYYYWNKNIKLKTTLILICINYIILIKKIAFFSPELYTGPSFMAVSFMLAFLIFIIGFLLNDKIKINKVLSTIEKLSYALFLNHLPISQLFIPFLFPILGYNISLLITALIVVSLSILQYKCIDLPSRKLVKNK